MRRGFTLIEILAVVAVIAAMLTLGLGSISAGKGAARVKGATRDVHAAIRHARSTALVTGQRVLVNYSNETVDGEVMAKVEVVAAKIMSVDPNRPEPQPYYVLDYKELPQPKERTPPSRPAAGGLQPTAGAEDDSGGETLEEYLFSPMSAKVVTGMRLKVLKGEEALLDETAEQTKSRISVFSNVDYLQSRYKEAKAAAAQQQAEATGTGEKAATGSLNDMDETVSVIWETNGAVEPHKVWVYPDGEKPEDGLLLNVDRFGAITVMDGEDRD